MTQRLRITFGRDGAARYVAHLDMMRAWERTLRRASLPLAYTQGFSPHARIAIAAPLPVGTIGRRELIDVWLAEPVPAAEAGERLRAAAPPGIEVVDIEEVGERLPSLQSSLRSAAYEVSFEPGSVRGADLSRRAEELLAQETLPWEEQRGKKTRRYDLRATVIALAVREQEVREAGEPEDGSQGDASQHGAVVLDMQLSMEEGKNGRPASVLAAMGVEAAPEAVVRTSIAVARAEVAMRAWRERGRFE